MQIVTRVNMEGGVSVEVIDPSDGAVTHAARPAVGEQVTVTATTARSPADIDWSGCEAIPEPESAEPVTNQTESEHPNPVGSRDAGVGQVSEAEGAEEPAHTQEPSSAA